MYMNATGRKAALHCTIRSKRHKASLWILMAKFAATIKTRRHHCRCVPHKRAAARMDVLIWKPSMWAAAQALEASEYDVATLAVCGACRRCTPRRAPATDQDSDSNMPPAKTQGYPATCSTSGPHVSGIVMTGFGPEIATGIDHSNNGSNRGT